MANNKNTNASENTQNQEPKMVQMTESDYDRLMSEHAALKRALTGQTDSSENIQIQKKDPNMVLMSEVDYNRLMTERAEMMVKLGEKIAAEQTKKPETVTEAAGETAKTIIDRLCQTSEENPNFFGRCRNYLKGRQEQAIEILQGHPFQAGRHFNDVHKANKMALYRRLGIQDAEATYTLLHPWRSLYNAMSDTAANC